MTVLYMSAELEWKRDEGERLPVGHDPHMVMGRHDAAYVDVF